MDGRVSPCDQWLDKATAGIRFGPDRRAVSEELAAHLEDKAAGLRRIFPDMTEEEVWERATSEMGDPAEIGKALARLHKPWLGYLWRASKWGAAILVVLLMAINLFLSDHFQSYGYALWGRESTVYGRTDGGRENPDGGLYLPNCRGGLSGLPSGLEREQGPCAGGLSGVHPPVLGADR